MTLSKFKAFSLIGLLLIAFGFFGCSGTEYSITMFGHVVDQNGIALTSNQPFQACVDYQDEFANITTKCTGVDVVAGLFTVNFDISLCANCTLRNFEVYLKGANSSGSDAVGELDEAHSTSFHDIEESGKGVLSYSFNVFTN
jgi:hypothetical protein